MKTKRMLAVMLAVVLMMSMLVACGSKGGSNAAVGTYKLDTIMGMSLADAAEAFGGSEEEVADMMKIELKDGGKLTMTVDGETGEGEWKLDGEKLTLTVDGEAQEATLKDGVITMEEEGMSVTFKK